MSVSRYAAGTRAWVDAGERGRVQAVYLGPAYWTNYPYAQYLVRAGDRMDLLAYATYNDPTRYWFIAEMNPTTPCPDDVKPGDTLHIPQNIV